MRRAVRATRTAISPRLAIRILSNTIRSPPSPAMRPEEVDGDQPEDREQHEQAARERQEPMHHAVVRALDRRVRDPCRDVDPGETDVERAGELGGVDRQHRYVEQHRRFEQVAEIVGRARVLERGGHLCGERELLRMDAARAHLSDAPPIHRDRDDRRERDHREHRIQDRLRRHHGCGGSCRGSGPACAPPNVPRSRSIVARTNRHTIRITHTMTTISSASTISAATGCSHASHSTTPTARSSPNDAAQFENGSGDVLIAIRLPVLARWLPVASVPPRIAAASVHAAGASPNTLAASAAPAGMRTNVWTKSHIESIPGILSAKNSIANIAPDAASTY